MKILKWVVGIVVCAWMGQYLLALLLPNLVMEVLYDQGVKQGGYNRLVINPVPDETSRDVVRPSPDLLYASCLYNLEDGPLVISATVPERYWSMQFYQMNTDNYFGITNQRQERHLVGSVVTVTLLGPGEEMAGHEGVVVESPSMRGIVLLRASAIGDRVPQQTALEASSCAPA